MADELAVETVLSGLHNPSGVAIRPDGTADNYEIYVSDSGAGRVVRVESGQPGASGDAISGFASKADVDDPFQSPGPRGLLFLDRTRLVVTGGDDGGNAFVRLYVLADQTKPLSAEQYEQHVEMKADDSSAVTAPASFHAVARTRANDHVSDLLMLTALGTDSPSGIWKMPVRAGTLGELEWFGSKDANDAAAAPAAITVGSHGYILISESTKQVEALASRLQFLNPTDGSVAMQVTAELQNVVGLAYSPRTGRLYAIDFAARDAERGGVYRIDDIGQPGLPECTAVKVAEVRRPTALAFGPDGALFVTAFGESDDSSTLLKIKGEL